MNWTAIGAVGELIGGLVVVVSLFYLALQIRQNTNAIRSSTQQAFRSALQTSNGYALANADVWHRGTFEAVPLKGEDYTRYLTIVHSALNAYEALFAEYLAGNVEEDFWQGKARQLAWVFRGLNGYRAWVEHTDLFDSRFVDYVTRNLLPTDPPQLDA